ncbi:MAG: hypothetical protein JNK27_03690 [Chitinophagaceae bacterium]|nr:hypothetical protein [Chitinophagaceae bacterium]
MFTKADIEKYFKAEKAESWIFMAIGIAGIVAAIVFFFLRREFYTGAAIPFLLVGLLLASVGYTVYRKSDNDRVRNVYAFDMNPSELKDKELPRMKTVMKNFLIYRWVEIFLFAAGAGLYIYFIRDFKNDFWRGFGLALAVMAILALAADFFAEKRGSIYTKGIESFVK